SISSVPEALGKYDNAIALFIAALWPTGPIPSVLMSGTSRSTDATLALALVGASGLDLLRGGGPFGMGDGGGALDDDAAPTFAGAREACLSLRSRSLTTFETE
ncbi:MAG: hypothetical protein ACKPKO_42200, partial [Candidatus Fonsibacter sp.]